MTWLNGILVSGICKKYSMTEAAGCISKCLKVSVHQVFNFRCQEVAEGCSGGLMP